MPLHGRKLYIWGLLWFFVWWQDLKAKWFSSLERNDMFLQQTFNNVLRYLHQMSQFLLHAISWMAITEVTSIDNICTVCRQWYDTSSCKLLYCVACWAQQKPTFFPKWDKHIDQSLQRKDWLLLHAWKHLICAHQMRSNIASSTGIYYKERWAHSDLSPLGCCLHMIVLYNAGSVSISSKGNGKWDYGIACVGFG